MQVSNISGNYYTPFRSNTNVKAISGFSFGEDGKLEVEEADKDWKGFAEFIDYQEFHRQWMAQGATTAFSYTENRGLDKEKNSISLVSGMQAGLANGQISMNMFYSSRTQDNSAYSRMGLEAFGIDTSKPFEINGKTFHYDSDGKIRLGDK